MPMLFPKRHAIGPRERAAVLHCISHYRQSGDDLPYGGVFYQQYAKDLCAYFGIKHALVVSSGTAALFVALRALALPAGSTVICSPITDPGCISAVTMNGLKLRLSDCAPGSFSMDPKRIPADLTPDVSAVLYVHAAGHATDLSELRRELDRRGVYLLEDVSQAHGARCGTTMAGQYGHVAAVSTMYRKAHVTGSNGGVILTDAPDIYRRAMMHADRGKDKMSERFDDRNPQDYELPGLNFNIDELACAIGAASLSRLDETREKRLAYVAAVRDRLSESNLNFTVSDLTVTDSPFLIPVKCPTEWSADSKTTFAMKLRDAGVPLNPHYSYVVADWNYARQLGISPDDVPQAKKSQADHFCLYVNENYGSAEADFVIEKMHEALRQTGT
jgi:dTDP-4-amino-4,6-dideoxygalactose transaminase